MHKTRAQRPGVLQRCAGGACSAAQAGTSQVAQRGGGRAAQRRLPRTQRGQQQRQVRGRGRGVRREQRQLLRVQHALQLGRRAVTRVRAGSLPAAYVRYALAPQSFFLSGQRRVPNIVRQPSEARLRIICMPTA